MIKVKISIQGRIRDLIPLFSSMEVVGVETAEEGCDAVSVEGSVLVDSEYLRSNTFIAFLGNAIKDADCFGRYEIPAVASKFCEERAKFVCLDGKWTEIEIDEWGNFTFPDPGSLAELGDFANRELEGMREFLNARDGVNRKMTPVDMRYTDTLARLREKYGEIMNGEEDTFLEVLKGRVQEIQEQTLANMTTYDAVEFLLNNLGNAGVALVFGAAEFSKEVGE